MESASNEPVVRVRGIPPAGPPRPGAGGLAFDLAAGEVLLLAGGTGSGKSTLLRMLLGLVVPRSGSVRLFGADPAAAGRAIPLGRTAWIPADPFDGERRRLGRIAREDAALSPGFAVDAWERFASLLDVPPAERADRLPRDAARRAALALALATGPELLLVDEPDGGGRRFLEELRRLPLDPPPAVILATASPADAVPLASRLVALRDGRLLLAMPTAELSRRVRRLSFTLDGDDASPLDDWFSLSTKIRGRDFELVVDDFDEERWETFVAREEVSEARHAEVPFDELWDELNRPRRAPGDADLPPKVRRVS